MGAFSDLNGNELHKIYRKKVHQLISARENRDYFREQSILYEMIQIEKLLGTVTTKNFFSTHSYNRFEK